MDGFRTARVLILDDDLAQAMPVIHALGLLGIGAIYHDGSTDSILPTKLTGVRLMFVDMVLAEHGADANKPDECIQMVANTLGRLVEDSSDPIIVICWTGHEPMTSDFQVALKKIFPKSKIDGVLVADKSQFSRPEDLQRLRTLISDALVAQNPVNILFRWEQLVHNAATKTTGAITHLIQKCGANENDAWSKYGYRIFAALALAERGTRLIDESENHAVKALFDALNPLLADSLDHDSAIGRDEASGLGEALLNAAKAEHEQWGKGRDATEMSLKRKNGLEFLNQHFAGDIPQAKIDALAPIPPEPISLLEPKFRAALNTMLHISTSVASGDITPGNIYFMVRNSTNRSNILSNPEWLEITDDTFFGLNGQLPANHSPVFMEISPVCDHAQAKSKMPRFLVGYLIPDGSTAIRQGAFLKRLGPLAIENAQNPNLSGVYQFVFNAHYIVSISAEKARTLLPTMRLRSPALNELAVWASNFASRPGLLHVGP